VSKNLERFLAEIVTDPEKYREFLRNPDRVMQEAGLSELEIAAVKSGSASAVEAQIGAQPVAPSSEGAEGDRPPPSYSAVPKPVIVTYCAGPPVTYYAPPPVTYYACPPPSYWPPPPPPPPSYYPGPVPPPPSYHHPPPPPSYYGGQAAAYQVGLPPSYSGGVPVVYVVLCPACMGITTVQQPSAPGTGTTGTVPGAAAAAKGEAAQSQGLAQRKAVPPAH